MDLPNYGVCVRQWKHLYTWIARSHSVQFLFFAGHPYIHGLVMLLSTYQR